VEGLANRVGKLHHAVQKLRALPATFWTVSPFDLQPGQGRLRGLLHRRPPGFACLNDASAGLARAPKGDAQPRPVFSHDPTGNLFRVQAQVMITRPMITTREAATGDVTKHHALQAIRKRWMLGEAVASWSFFQSAQKWQQS
jgi:hypothetical protein